MFHLHDYSCPILMLCLTVILELIFSVCIYQFLSFKLELFYLKCCFYKENIVRLFLTVCAWLVGF